MLTAWCMVHKVFLAIISFDLWWRLQGRLPYFLNPHLGSGWVTYLTNLLKVLVRRCIQYQIFVLPQIPAGPVEVGVFLEGFSFPVPGGLETALHLLHLGVQCSIGATSSSIGVRLHKVWGLGHPIELPWLRWGKEWQLTGRKCTLLGLGKGCPKYLGLYCHLLFRVARGEVPSCTFALNPASLIPRPHGCLVTQD